MQGLKGSTSSAVNEVPVSLSKALDEPEAADEIDAFNTPPKPEEHTLYVLESTQRSAEAFPESSSSGGGSRTSHDAEPGEGISEESDVRVVVASEAAASPTPLQVQENDEPDHELESSNAALASDTDMQAHGPISMERTDDTSLTIGEPGPITERVSPTSEEEDLGSQSSIPLATETNVDGIVTNDNLVGAYACSRIYVLIALLHRSVPADTTSRTKDMRRMVMVLSIILRTFPSQSL